jgi:hypothetical protein
MSTTDDSPSPAGNGNDAAQAAPPTDAAGWRELIAAAPPKDLLRLIQKEKPRAARLLSGFRAAPEAVRNPVIVSRLVDEAIKQPAFAQEAAEALAAPHDGNGTPTAKPTRSSGTLAPAAQAKKAEDPKLREQINKQRAALKEQSERMARLEEQVAQLTPARADAEGFRADARAAEEEADRQRRLREREGRKAAASVAKAEEGAAATVAAVTAAPATAPAPTSPTMLLVLEEAMSRLISRGKYAVVAEVCREAMVGGRLKDAPAAARGKVHALYAAALYGQSEDERAAEQDQRACVAFLDAGDVEQAGESFARILAHDSLLRAALTGEDTTLLRRLVLLADKANRAEPLRAGFLRLRLRSPRGFALLVNALRKSGKKFADFAGTLTPAAGGAGTLGPDEVVSLPIPPGGAVSPSVTARGLAQAVDSGDARYVMRVRDAIAELRRAGGSQGAATADALLAAVADLSETGVIPYTSAPGTAARGIVVDASNVARHDPDPLSLSATPRVATLLAMRDFLLRRGFFPVLLIADATLRYHVDDRAAYLALVERGLVRETPPGTSADETLIAEAREREAPLVTNDRLSEWGDAARRIERVGFAVHPGGVSLLS